MTTVYDKQENKYYISNGELSIVTCTGMKSTMIITLCTTKDHLHVHTIKLYPVTVMASLQKHLGVKNKDFH